MRPAFGLVLKMLAQLGDCEAVVKQVVQGVVLGQVENRCYTYLLNYAPVGCVFCRSSLTQPWSWPEDEDALGQSLSPSDPPRTNLVIIWHKSNFTTISCVILSDGKTVHHKEQVEKHQSVDH